jgi:hypothetical protein
MKNLFNASLLLCLLAISCTPSGKDKSNLTKSAEFLTISRDSLKDKIMGGWAGQTIGVTYGGPTEFRFEGTMIQDYQPIPWYEGYLKKWYIEGPGLYDDLYMDLTFVDVFERCGLDAPVDSFSQAFAHAGYMLWHANEIGRYNILKGLKAPESGNWLNNPHADCIDFQIESDFAGLMSPAMTVSATQICDKIGHIMNYGDGWYGGVFVASMYTLAVYNKDIDYIVNEALKSIPEKSEFYQCISDVIKWHKLYPNDWKQTWFEVQKKWTQDIGCPDGVFNPFNIDAKVNAAYVVIGLLYGNSDFGKTIDIATRCGQDSDCNPSTAGGILGAVLGYSKIPSFWKLGLKEVEGMNFKYTSISLNKTYEYSFKHALAMIERNGGKVSNKDVTIKIQHPLAVKFEKSFDGLYPVFKKEINRSINKSENDSTIIAFEGTGIVLTGSVRAEGKKLINDKQAAKLEVYLNNNLSETIELPYRENTRRDEIFFKYQLPKQGYKLKIKVIELLENAKIIINSAIVYSDAPANVMLTEAKL